MNKLYDFMRGRYGADELSWTTAILGVILLIVFSFMEVWFILIPLALFGVVVFRTLSRDVAARQRENDVFIGIFSAPVRFVKLAKNKARDRDTHIYFKCPSCARVLRVPRGRGEIKVTCPICKHSFTKKT